MEMWIGTALYVGEELDSFHFDQCRPSVRPYYSPHSRVLRLTTPVEAVILEDAMHKALDKLLMAARDLGVESSPVMFNVRTEQEHLREIAGQKWDLVGAGEIAQILGVSRSRVSQLADNNIDFPDPVARLRSGRVFDRGEVLRFKSKWKRIPGRPRNAVAQEGCEI